MSMTSSTSFPVVMTTQPGSQSEPQQATTPTKRKRGRPSKKSPQQLLRKGESTMQMSINGSLNVTAHNSAAVARLGVSTTTPVMKLSPQKRRANISSMSSVSQRSTPSHNRISLSTIPESDHIVKAHNALASITNSTHDRNLTPVKGSFSIPSSSPVCSSVSSNSPVLQSSPLKTSPITDHTALFNQQKGKLGPSNGTMITYGEDINFSNNNIMSSPYSVNVNPSLLQSSPVTSPTQDFFNPKPIPPSTPKVYQGAMPGMMLATPTSLRKYLAEPSTPTTHFSAVLNSSPMYTHWYTQTPQQPQQQQQTRIMRTPNHLVPKQLKIDDIIKTPQGGLMIRSEQMHQSPFLLNKSQSQEKQQTLPSIQSTSPEQSKGLGIKQGASVGGGNKTKNVDILTQQLKTGLRKTQSLSSVQISEQMKRKQESAIPSALSTPSARKHPRDYPELDFPNNVHSSPVSLLPPSLQIGITIDADGKASVVTKRRKICVSSPHSASSPSYGPRTPLIKNYNYVSFEGGYVTGTPPPGLRIGIDPFVNGISSNEFESYPQQQAYVGGTPDKMLFSPTQEFVSGNIHQQLQSHIISSDSLLYGKLGGNNHSNSNDESMKSDARFALKALLDQM
ncbi:unnamed protein product [Ambrosiozyma monospora]|uniref:Unnamed protein product n=1 Tax=Ambrosiozyma monospora TaxID=43982 RepID=A0ACB5SYI4_AMBMO|nr:unnamed protein product [Ambrosiozyma monospora]